MPRMMRTQVIWCLPILFSLAGGFVHGQAQQAAGSRLASIQVKGTARYTPEDVMRLSGLAIGTPITVEDLTAATTRLAATGLFDMVKYSYTTGRQMTVTFDVTEAKWTVPVLLDNFVWMSDDDLKAAVRTEVPTFDGTAPINSGAAELIEHALQDFVKARGVPGQVTFSAQADIGGPDSTKPRYLYAVKDPAPKLCALHVEGASTIPEKQLLDPLTFALNDDYSRLLLTASARGTLTDMYRRRGYWRATFAPPTVALNACPGVSATLHVSEGQQYTWDKPSWSGINALPAAPLEAAFGIKVGDVADATKIDTGIRAVSDAYGKLGYIAERARSTPKLDDATRRVTVEIAIEEGAQFHMGTLDFPNLADADATTLKKRFKLKPGDVYDDSYVQKYMAEEVRPLQTRGGGRPALMVAPNETTHTVDLHIVFR